MYILTRSSLFWIFLGGLCYYLALPPVNFAPLALTVPIFWGIVIRRPHLAGTPRLKLKRQAYFAALLFWLASVWWVACPYPALTTLGLFALAAFLSFFWVLFFVSARVAVHRFRIPLFLAMPFCWVGTEYIRFHILGGFSFCALEHAFYLHPECIQLASVGGNMLVGGMVFWGGALITSGFFQRKTKAMLCCFVAAILVLGLPPLLGYHLIEAKQKYGENAGEQITRKNVVALQGNRQIYIDNDIESAAETFGQFVRLTYKTVDGLKNDGKPLPDLIVFPETVCHVPILRFEGSVKPADIGLTESDVTDWERQFREFAQKIETPILLGLSTYTFKNNPEKPIRLNSALLVQPQVGDEPSKMYRYDKMHLVMFGEYVPFTVYLPDDFFLKTVCPEAEHGTKPIAIPIGQGRGKMVEASINICFESSVSHLIRKQILTLRREGHDPRVLINLSNDGWFRNSHQMEQHMATHVFRAVENGMDYITATNGGFSAIIDPYGRIQKMGERGAAETVSDTIYLKSDTPHSLTIYQKYGDWYALPLAVGVLFLVGIAFWEKKRNRNR